jgi:hypothetical protein
LTLNSQRSICLCLSTVMIKGICHHAQKLLKITTYFLFIVCAPVCACVLWAHTYMCVVCTCVHAYMCVVYMCVHMCACIYVCCVHVCAHVCMCVCVHAIAYVWLSEDDSEESVHSFHHVNLGCGTQVTVLVEGTFACGLWRCDLWSSCIYSKALYPLSYLPSPCGT